jgi:hypothetical protein
MTAQVVLTDTLTGFTYSGETDSGGTLLFSRLYTGTYDLQVDWQGQTNAQTVTLAAGAAVTVEIESDLPTEIKYFFPMLLTAE